jgi:hypothetical protein
MAKLKEVDCYRCGSVFMAKRIKTLCKKCALEKYIERYVRSNDKKEQKIYETCVNCLENKTISTAAYCAVCYSPISDKLWKFNKMKSENKIRNEIVISKVEQEGITPLNAYLVCDAWLYITRYDNKWLTKSTIQQVKLMLEELKEYNMGLYTKYWWDEEGKKMRAERRKERN